MAPPTPTSGDMKLFFFVLKNCKGKPIIDWDAVAAETGLKNADTAKVGTFYPLMFTSPLV